MTVEIDYNFEDWNIDICRGMKTELGTSGRRTIRGHDAACLKKYFGRG